METVNPEFNLTNVQEEIHNWVVNYLDVPSDYYSGNKPCPFAKKAWLSGQCKVLLGGDQDVLNVLETWDDKYELVIVAVSEEESDGLDEWCKQINRDLLPELDLVLMPFIAGDEDPDDPNLDPDHWGKLLDEAYSLVFIQRLTVVNRISELLEATGYYDKLGPEFMSYVKERRGL